MADDDNLTGPEAPTAVLRILSTATITTSGRYLSLPGRQGGCAIRVGQRKHPVLNPSVPQMYVVLNVAEVMRTPYCSAIKPCLYVGLLHRCRCWHAFLIQGLEEIVMLSSTI